MPRPQVLQPRSHKEIGLGLDPFRSPLLRTSRLISLPPGTEMFQFPGFASSSLRMTGCNTRRVAPFGHLRITACVPLPGASRSLPRPSSPLCAQASPTCLLSLDYKNVQAEIRALLSQSTYTARLHCGLRRRVRRSVKIPFPTNMPPTKRPKVDDPSSVFHFSNSDPRLSVLSR